MPNKALVKRVKDLWIRGKNDPEIFFRYFCLDRKGKPISLTYDKRMNQPVQRELMDAFRTGLYDELYVSGGNSSGKTFSLEEIGTWGAIWKVYPKREPHETLAEFNMRNYGVLCTGAEQKHSNELWDGIRNMFARSPALASLVANVAVSGRINPHPRITLKNGAYIDSIGLHERGKHAVTGDYSLVLINEIAEVRDLRYILENILTQRTWRHGGLIIGSGTMRGKHTEYWEVLRRGMPRMGGNPNPIYKPNIFTTFADARENRFADQERVQAFMATHNQSLIDERVRGLPVEMEGSAFLESKLDEIFTSLLPFQTNPDKRKMDFVHGLDFGRKQDYTVMITLDIRKKPWRGINFYRKGGGYGTWEEIFADIKAIHNLYGGEIFADTTASGGDFASEWLTELDLPFMGVDFTKSPARKLNLINQLQKVIQGGKDTLLLPHTWEEAKDELRIYPANLDDKAIKTDCVIALGLACVGGDYYGDMTGDEILRM